MTVTRWRAPLEVDEPDDRMPADTPERRALRRAAYERRHELLMGAEIREMVHFIPERAAGDLTMIAWHALLWRHRRELWHEEVRLYTEHNPRDGELVTVVPAYSLPWPTSAAGQPQMQVMGRTVELGPVDGLMHVEYRRR